MNQNKHSAATTEEEAGRLGDCRDGAERGATKPAARLRAGVRAGVGLGPDDEEPQLPPRRISDLWV